MKRDGHIHSPYCPHGTNDTFEDYVETAISLGFEEITFTEHAPLPKGFIDPTPARDSGMNPHKIHDYFHDIEIVKNKYQRQIKINCGLEIDYIEGFEEETKSFLAEFGQNLDDAILSVHFLKLDNGYECMDYSPEVFGEMVKAYGSVEALYRKYYETVKKSILADLGPYKPKRIGHMTLAHKFKNKFPVTSDFKNEIEDLLLSIKVAGYELDYNGAGTAKPLCREPYPPSWVVDRAIELEIPLVYGSDAHRKKELAQGLPYMNFTKTS